MTRPVGWLFVLAALLTASLGAEVPACSLCGDLGATPTFRQEAALPMSKAILFGSIANPRTGGRNGETDFHVTRALRTHSALKEKKTVVLPRYLPVTDKDKPPSYVVFCDVDGKKIDPYRGIEVRGPGAAEYLKKALALDAKDATGALAFFFQHLEDPDPEVAKDAFLEFARASDADIVKAAAKFDISKVRGWLTNKTTRPERLGVYAMLLGVAGKKSDATFLRELFDSKEERMRNAADGILAGYIALAPDDGWKLVDDTLRDGRKSLTLRITLMRTLRFYHGANPKENKPHILKAMKSVLAQGDLADLAAEDLRRFQLWDLTGDILPLYNRKGFDAPLMSRAIIRYALCAPSDKRTQAFLAARRADELDVVQEVEEGLRIEKEAQKR